MKRAALLLLAALASALKSQEMPAAADSALARASRIAAKDSAAARKLLDSLASKGESPLVRAEAMYQQSLIASSSAEREGILAGLIVDYPFSPRVPSALLGLGTLELARNDRDRAALHLSRYLASSVKSDTNRIPAALALGRLQLERGEVARGCAALLVGRSELPESALEMRTQFDFSVGRCQGVDTAVKLEAKPAADTTPAQKRTGAFTVQVAAYDTRKAADQLATKLRGQGLEARVVGTSKPFRVRVGRYATRADAEDASRRIDAVAKSSSIVVIVGPEER